MFDFVSSIQINTSFLENWLSFLSDAVFDLTFVPLNALLNAFPSTPDFITELFISYQTVVDLVASYNWLLPVEELFNVIKLGLLVMGIGVAVLSLLLGVRLVLAGFKIIRG